MTSAKYIGMDVRNDPIFEFDDCHSYCAERRARMVVDEGIELTHAIDTFAGQQGIRDGQGAWGILTGGLITRTPSAWR